MQKLKNRLSRIDWVTVSISFLSLFLIAWGTHQIYSPCAPAVVGGLLWLELARTR